MKRHCYLTYVVLLQLLCACAVGETETLKQARAIQNEILTGIAQLDTSFASYTNRLSSKIDTLSADTMLQEDTLLLKTYNTSKANLDNVNLAHAELMNWKSTMKMLPSVEEIAKGAANPFGESATDVDAFNGMKKQHEEVIQLKNKLENIINSDHD